MLVFEKNIIKSIQSKLRECGVYPYPITGNWDENTHVGYISVFKSYLGNGFSAKYVSPTTSYECNLEALVSIQCDLDFLNLYNKDINCNWDYASNQAFDIIVNEYKEINRNANTVSSISQEIGISDE